MTVLRRGIRDFNCLSIALVAAGIAHSALCAEPGPQTASAAEKPNAVFLEHCSICHGSDLGGGQFGPPLRGAGFAAKWHGKEEALLRYVRSNMPPANPGSLTAEETSSVLSYIAQANALGVVDAPLPDQSPESKSRSAASNSLTFSSGIGPTPAGADVFRDQVYHREIDSRKRKLDSLSPVTDSMLRTPPVEDWLLWRGSYENISYSSLAQINTNNVSRLATAWAWSLPISANEIEPLVHDGVIFISSANQVQALDAASGTLLWRYVRDLPPQFRGASSILRNLAIYGDNVYLATADRHTIALEVKTGRLVWEHQIVADGTPGVFLTAGPIAVRGKILQGTSNGAMCRGGCFIVALDARSGAEVWHFNTIARPGQPGGDSWNGTPSDERYGGAVWVAGSFDPDTNLVFYGVGGTYDAKSLLSAHDGVASKKNNGLYTGSTIALNADTGKLVWYHQHFPHEVWDMDEAFERALVSLPIDGKLRKLVVNTGKLGILDALDRSNGAYVFSKDFGLQNIFVAIDPHTGKRTFNPAMMPEPNKSKSVCPSPEGARNWMSIAFNPDSHVMYFPIEETCMDFRWQPENAYQPGGPHMDIGWTVKPRPDSDGNYARLEAVDMTSLKTMWVRRSRSPPSSSLLLTKGGILFSGSRDRTFSASNETTGDTLWSVRLNAVPNSSPITYSVGGKQFIAVVTGGGGFHDFGSEPITPEIDDSAPSTTLWVFAVP